MSGAMSETTPLIRPERRSCCDIALRVRILTSIISFAEGYDIGVVNGAVVLFREELELKSWQVGVALCIFALGVSIAAPMAGSFADYAGRKAAMMVASTLLIIGGLLMACATSFEMLISGRVVAGCGAGVGLTAVTAYMSEVSPAHSRGFYGSLEELFVNVGNVAGYLVNLALLGVPYDWRLMLGLGIVPAFCVLIVLILPYSLTGIPESPRWLQKVGRLEEARAILSDLLNDEEEVEKASQAWRLEVQLQGDMATWRESLIAFATTHRRAALAGIGCGIINMFTGIQLMMVTTTSLLIGTGMTKDGAMKVSIVLGITKAMVMLGVAIFMLDSWGRRPLLQTSLAVCSLASALGSGGAYFNLGEAWVIIGLCIFVTGYSLGVGPVPWVYMPEVIENRFRGKGCAIGLSCARLCAVTHLFFFPILFPIIGIEGLFLFLLAVNCAAFFYVIAFCPETKGLSLEQIQAVFHADAASGKVLEEAK
jgi:sugar porter (SP) family MFS transporter